jgi:outer membrane receptor protein involved in Fe transport
LRHPAVTVPHGTTATLRAQPGFCEGDVSTERFRLAGSPLRGVLAGALALGLALGAASAPARAEDPPPAAAGAQEEWRGAIRGQVFDGRTGAPVPYATVTLVWPAPADGGEPRRDVQVCDPNGAFEFPAVPAGDYTLAFSKPGYQSSTLTAFSVRPDRLDRADFRLAPQAGPAPGEPPEDFGDVEEFVVLGARVEALEASRAESDELINTLSAEEFSKFAASDVADALKFVAGVNVVEGQFAIIRGLEDRYSSTLYNSAPIPSPDPDKQSVQLDLFASDIVGNLVVAKTFGADLPSNSSAGSINILTHDYPEEIEAKVQAGGGFNENAVGNFLGFREGSAVGSEQSGADTIESDFVGSLGGRVELLEREFRFKGVVAQEIDYQTAEGFQEVRQPRKPDLLDEGGPFQEVLRSGSLAFGELSLTGGQFDLDVSERERQRTAYGGIGFDLDEDGDHRIDGSIFYTRKDQESVEWRRNGYLPGFDYGVLADYQQNNGIIDPTLLVPPTSGIGGCQQEICATPGSWIATTIRDGEIQNPVRGPLWYSSFLPSRSFDVTRDLTVYQVNGEHRTDLAPGLRLTWAANHASTTQSETALGARIFYEPQNESLAGFVIPTAFPVTPEALQAADEATPGGAANAAAYATNGGILSSRNEIDESGSFARFDLEWEREIFGPLLLKLTGGGWFENAQRDVDSRFIENPTVGGSSNYAILDETPQALGAAIFQEIDGEPLRITTNDSERDVKAGSFGAKATLWDAFDVLGGLRIEDISIRSDNDPFTGAERILAPGTFPDVYVLFDRLDNPYRGEIGVYNPSALYNNDLLGIDVPLAPCQAPGGAVPDPTQICADLWNPLDPTDRAPIEALIDGEIDELEFLPSAGLAWRPLEGLSVRGAWSRTLARPSFREIGFYASVELGTDDLVVGNPQLTLSDVESWDARVEYLWGELGELAAVSAFYKTIDRPIESIVVRNPIDPQGNALYRTFFNNPNTATLWGIELEARKNLGFLRPGLLEYLSLGGNFTWIDATVDRTEAELGRAQVFFETRPDESGSYTGLEPSRRLFGQPEWIVNADLSFEQPDWGSKITLAVFAISDLLDAAGTADLSPDLRVTALTLDRYVDSFYTLDLVATQTFPFDLPLGWIGLDGTLPSALAFKLNVKNLTDSTRRIVYDRQQTSKRVAERSFKIGRDYSFSVVFSVAF